MRYVFILAGLVALVASTMMAIGAAGGLSAAVTPGLIALGVLLAVGAAAIGHALTLRHIGLAVAIGLGMVAGEVGAMIQTAQRVTAAREAQRAPFVADEQARAAAVAELAAAEAAEPRAVPRTRLDVASAAKATAERTVAEKAAEKGCRENCRQLLQAAVDAAAREVDGARAEVAEKERRQSDDIAQRIASAKAAVSALKPPQSATPLADHSGIPEWLLDVVEALTLSLAINLPASALIALGVKMRQPAVAETKEEKREPETIEAVAVTVTAREHAARFGVEALAPHDGSTPVVHLHNAYLDWCRDKGHKPFAAREIAAALLDLFARSGVEIQQVDGRPHVMRARLRGQIPALSANTAIGVQA